MAQFSLCCILVLFCFYFVQYPMQIENIVSNPAHPHVERSNIKLVFLPPNTTSKLQPCDAGIIQTVKLCYRTKLLRRIAFAIDEVESASLLAKKVNLFDAIMWLRPECMGFTITNNDKEVLRALRYQQSKFQPRGKRQYNGDGDNVKRSNIITCFGWGHAGRVCQA